MSTTLPTVEPSPDDATASPSAGDSLAALRSALDAIDDGLHDLLMRRAGIVEKVGLLKGRISLRPGREAEIIRRLLARHQGGLPPGTLVRIWRELLAGTNAMQGDFTITVFEPDPALGYALLAREHFGALTPMHVHRSPAQAIAEISAGRAAAAVLPRPTEEDPPAAAWWLALLHRDEPRIHVIARLPFWAPRPEGASRVQAFVAAAIAPDPSARDRSLLGLELSPEVSRARLAAALATAGFTAGEIILRRPPGAGFAHALAEVEGFVADDDPRLPALGAVLRPPVVLGSYAVPLDGVPA